MAITGRDRQILYFVNQHGFASVAQVQKKFELSSVIFYKRAKIMKNAGLFKYQKLLTGHPSVCWCTPEGAEICESPLGAPSRPSIANIYHDLLCVDMSMYLLQEMKDQGKNATWFSAREIKAAQMAAVDRQNKKEMFATLAARTPDGVLDVDGVKIAVELEFTLINRSRLTKILNDYALRLFNGEYASVAYYCAKPSILRVVSEEVQKLSTVERFQVFELPEALKNKKGASLCKTL